MRKKAAAAQTPGRVNHPWTRRIVCGTPPAGRGVLLLVGISQENFARLCAHLWAHHALVFHVFDDPRGAVVPDLETPLNVGNRSVPSFGHDGDRFVTPTALRSVFSNNGATSILDTWPKQALL